MIVFDLLSGARVRMQLKNCSVGDLLMVFLFRKNDAGSERLCGRKEDPYGQQPLFINVQLTVKSLHNIHKGNCKLPLTEI